MRLIFFTDVQLSGLTPRHRVDDYQNALASKVEEVYSVAANEEADAVICGGDLFNSHRIFTYELLSRVMDAICDSGVNTWTIIGQHDLTGYNQDTYKSSTLGFVASRCNRFKVIWEPVKISSVTLFPSHVWEDPMDAARFAPVAGQFNILVSHHLLTNRQTVFETVNTEDYWRKLRETGVEFDLVLSGDLHDGYEVHQCGNTWFCNPGSVARQAISDISRVPKYAVIDVEPGNVPVIDVRAFKCAAKGEDVFGENVAEVAGNPLDFDPTAFVKEIEGFEAESADVHELVQKTGKARGIRGPVLEYLARKASSPVVAKAVG